jgi:hypothetical protein
MCEPQCARGKQRTMNVWQNAISRQTLRLLGTGVKMDTAKGVLYVTVSNFADWHAEYVGRLRGLAGKIY